jgi:hypothetical protein
MIAHIIITMMFGERLIPIRPKAVKSIEKKVTFAVPNFLKSLPATNATPPEQTPVMML